MPSYKLHYFHATGRVEIARMLFTLKGVKFEDVTYTREEFQKVKSDMPMEQLPVLEVDGVKYGQASAICSYLARELGAYGKDSKQTFMIDELVESVTDIFQALTKIFMERGSAKGKTPESTDMGSLSEWMKKFKPVLARYVKDYPNDEEVTLAEITVCVIVAFIKGLTKGAVAVDSLMQDFANKVERNPILRKYIANRPHDGITKR